jgi:flagellar protein FliJ
MTKSQRLKPVTRVAENREQEAALAMAEAQQALNEREARLNELLSYRAEYHMRYKTASSTGMEAAQIQDYRHFIAKLDQAISGQLALVEGARGVYEETKRQWFATRSKSLALDKVVTRYRHQEVRSTERREQGEADERNQHLKPALSLDSGDDETGPD